mmetsp:Transcript_36637/g.91364  ORF Transcript_36637/g.91364 Transcript_36637/m.91364 type:complete len:204 (+) Transcript_36637:320-931(+)
MAGKEVARLAPARMQRLDGVPEWPVDRCEKDELDHLAEAAALGADAEHGAELLAHQVRCCYQPVGVLNSVLGILVEVVMRCNEWFELGRAGDERPERRPLVARTPATQGWAIVRVKLANGEDDVQPAREVEGLKRVERHLPLPHLTAAQQASVREQRGSDVLELAECERHGRRDHRRGRGARIFWRKIADLLLVARRPVNANA